MNADPESDDKEVTAPEYILENFELSDRKAILVRDSERGETIQRITTSDMPQARIFRHGCATRI